MVYDCSRELPPAWSSHYNNEDNEALGGEPSLEEGKRKPLGNWALCGLSALDACLGFLVRGTSDL